MIRLEGPLSNGPAVCSPLRSDARFALFQTKVSVIISPSLVPNSIPPLTADELVCNEANRPRDSPIELQS